MLAQRTGRADRYAVAATGAVSLGKRTTVGAEGTSIGGATAGAGDHSLVTVGEDAAIAVDADSRPVKEISLGAVIC